MIVWILFVLFHIIFFLCGCFFFAFQNCYSMMYIIFLKNILFSLSGMTIIGLHFANNLQIFSSLFFFCHHQFNSNSNLMKRKKSEKWKMKKYKILKVFCQFLLLISGTLINLSNIFTNFAVLFYNLIIVVK